MPQLFGQDVSPDVYEANKHLATPPKQPKTEARKEVDRLQREALERRFDTLWLKAGGDPDFWLRGYLFDTERGWHLDRYNKQHRIAVEIHGGQFAKNGRSGHRNPGGMQRDWDKLNRCTELGITLWVLVTATVNIDEVDRLKRYIDKLQP